MGWIGFESHLQSGKKWLFGLPRVEIVLELQIEVVKS